MQASPQASLEEEEEANKRVVKALYEALRSQDVDTVHHLLAPHIEWWFHGPRYHHHHMMRLLTGTTTSPHQSFTFKPLSFVAFGSTVLVEGHDSISWVHAWTVTHGIITQLREYFNTSVKVTRFGNSNVTSQSSSPSMKCQSIWQSKLSDNSSVPGLVLAL
ncbi:wound-induced protein 1-like [Cornus florida]|uniref:wound-induced protein 1-like n=1 Tax=Cornus florida TaxID=4283 RepID=UPI00289B8E6D|nr:wound-induced protein 1-like [Cornus florida]